MAFTVMLNRRVTVYRSVSDGTSRDNQPKMKFEVWKTNVPMAIRALTGIETTEEKQMLIATHRAVALRGLALQQTDRIEDSEGVYDVVFVRRPSGHGHHVEVDLKEHRA